MNQDLIQISFGNSTAEISDKGSALVTLCLEGDSVIPESTSPRHPYHGVMLAPWPNRIAEGKYSFDGTNYQLPINETLGNALHGFAFDQVAKVHHKTDNSVTLETEIKARESYPFDLTVEITFTLGADGLSVKTSATNHSESSCPVGLGTHPFFIFDEDSTLEVKAQSAAIHGEDMLPISRVQATEIGFGPGVQRSIEGLALDVQFDKLSKDCAILRTANWGIEIWQEGADWLMVYTTQEYNWADGSVRAVAIEPQTCSADSFNNQEGLKVLEPKQSFSYLWGVKKLS